MKFDPAGVVEAAQSALARGPELDDVPILALAAARAFGELAEQLEPFMWLWEQLPGATAQHLPELRPTLDAALELGKARAALFSLRSRPAHPAAQEAADAALELSIRDRMAALAARAPSWEYRHAAADREAARQQIAAEEADVLRRHQGEIAVLERQLDDRLRLVWAAVRRAGR